jgi:hypothetical protein
VTRVTVDHDVASMAPAARGGDARVVAGSRPGAADGAPAARPRLAILFWFYRDPALCADRLRLLKRYNAGVPIYGLYGGPPAEAGVFQRALAPWLDDFYAYAVEQSSAWKWRNGDLMIAEWFRARGHALAWDSVVVVQWDMLVLGDVRDLFADLGRDEILLSSLCPVEEVAAHWYWMRASQRKNHERFRAFQEHLRTSHGYDGPLYACLFLVVCLPRRFLDPFSRIEAPELGWIEYRVPTYANLFGVPLRRLERFDGWWHSAPDARRTPRRERVLVATGSIPSIPMRTVRYHLRRPGGARIFHPFVYPFPDGAGATLRFVVNRQRAEIGWRQARRAVRRRANRVVDALRGLRRRRAPETRVGHGDGGS